MYRWLLSILILFYLSFSINVVEAFNIPLVVKERVGVERTGEPVTSGIPFPKGMLSSDQNVSIQDIPAQFQTLSKWPDGSVKWLLVDFQSNVGANKEKVYYLTNGSGNAGDSKLKLTEFTKDITVITGPMKFIISKEHFNLFDGVWIDKNNNDSFEDVEKIISPDVLDNEIIISDCFIGELVPGGYETTMYENYYGTYSSSLVAPTEVTIEENGPVRAVIKIKGRYKNSTGTLLPDYINYTVRVHAYAGKDYVRVFYTLENNGLYKESTEYTLKDQWLYFDRLSINSGLNLSTNKTISTDNYVDLFSNNSFRLYQDHEVINETDESKNFFYTITKDGNQTKTTGRNTGWIDINDSTCGVTVGIRHFWQNYDKAISFNNNKLSLELWPTEDYWPYNSTGQQRQNYQFEGGRHKTYELLFRFYSGNKDQNLIKAFNTPLFVVAPPTWYADSKALGMIAPGGLTHTDLIINQSLSRFEQLQRCKIYLKDSEAQGEVSPTTIDTERENRYTSVFPGKMDLYGWFHFGDLPWNPSEERWCSLHYDWTYSMLLHFIRTSDYGFFDKGIEMVRHRQDIDQYHSIGNHENSLWYGYLSRYEKGWHGDIEIYPGREMTGKLTHTWNEGLILCYLLTGDRAAFEAALENGQAVINNWRKIRDIENTNRDAEVYELRNQGWSIINLLNLYRATGNSDYLNLAKAIFKNSLLWMEVKNGSRGYWGDKSDKLDEQSMVQFSYIIEPLIQLHYETQDDELKNLLIRMANWLKTDALYGGYKSRNLYMPFWSYYQWKQGGGVATSKAVIRNFFYTDLFAYCYLLTNNETYLTLARQVFKDATFYYQVGWDSIEIPMPINPVTLSKISYIPRMYPGSESKIHGWTGRTSQVFLWTEYQLQKGTQSTLTKIVINPDRIYLKVNTSCQFTATGYDQDNNLIPNVVFTWQIVGEIGSLSTTTGTSTIFTANTTTNHSSIIVTYGSISASADIIVTSGTPSSMTYPNPAKEKVTFTDLTTNSKIRVFNLAGELVWEERSLLGEDKYWDVKNKKVASDIYIYIITNDKGDIKRGKLGIIK
ncbi:MAG: T9SS type A sorting domain-containing protein [Nitrospirota bacterium]